MVMIAAISIDAGTGFNKKSAEVKLASDKTSYERITVDLTEDETKEIIKLVSEIIATRLRLPVIREKIEAAMSAFPPAPIPGSSADVPMKVTETISSADPKPGIICPIHNVAHDSHQDCPMCVEARPAPNPDADVPF